MNNITTTWMNNSLLTEGEKWDVVHSDMDDAYNYIIEPILEEIKEIRILQTNRSLINCDIIDLMDGLSESGKDLILLCRTGAIDLKQIYKGCHKKSGIRPVFKFLKNIGWSRQQIMTGINDLKQIFNIKGE